MTTAEPRDATWVLIHSPLVGPATLQPLADALRRQGRAATVPPLLTSAESPSPGWLDSIASVGESLATTEAIVLVGHSGAGYLLPAIAKGADAQVVAFAFVDARLPPAAGTTPLVPVEFLPQLETLADDDGVLPPWSTWFPHGVFEAMVPDDAQRAALDQELPRLPLAALTEQVPVPRGWDDVPCAYLLLSPEQYRPMADDAEQRGWATAVLDNAHHLSTVTEPDAVADALVALIER